MNTLEELVAHFGSQLDSLKLRVELRDASGEEMCQTVLSSIQSNVQGLSAVLSLLRAEVVKQKEQLKAAEALKTKMVDLEAQLTYALDNIPARLPHKEQCLPQSEVRQDLAPQTRCPAPAPSANPPVKPKKAFYVQQVELLTMDEFMNVPKYMRGRLTYDQVNSTVEELNKALTAKYKLLGQKRNKLSDINRKKWEAYKTQENKESTGFYFIVDADIKASTSLKIDSAFRTMITILRHCGRIKEIRGGGLTRYAVLLFY